MPRLSGIWDSASLHIEGWKGFSLPAQGGLRRGLFGLGGWAPTVRRVTSSWRRAVFLLPRRPPACACGSHGFVENRRTGQRGQNSLYGAPAELSAFGAAGLFALTAGLLLLTAVRDIGCLGARAPEYPKEHRHGDNVTSFTHRPSSFPPNWPPILQERGRVCQEA